MMVTNLLIVTVIFVTWAKSAAAQDVAAGEAAFRKCQVCHDVGENARNKLGPPLMAWMAERPGASRIMITATPTKIPELLGPKSCSASTSGTRQPRSLEQR